MTRGPGCGIRCAEFRVASVAALAAALSMAMATAPDWPVTFIDVAAEAGLTRPSMYGGVDKKRFIIETNGAGAALVDVTTMACSMLSS